MGMLFSFDLPLVAEQDVVQSRSNQLSGHVGMTILGLSEVNGRAARQPENE